MFEIGILAAKSLEIDFVTCISYILILSFRFIYKLEVDVLVPIVVSGYSGCDLY